MDIQRKNGGRQRQIHQIILLVVALIVIGSISIGLSRLKPAAPTVERATVWVDTVTRGQMLREVRGLGTLVPEDIRWIPSVTEGRVERILVRPGASVTNDSVLLELSNPKLEQELMDAELQLKAGQAEAISLRVKLESERLDQQSVTYTLNSNYTQAKLRADSDEQLAKDGLISELNQKLSQATAEELAARKGIEQKRLEIKSESMKAQLDAQQARIEQLQALCQLKKNQVGALQVRAGTIGVVQQIPVEVGQQVAPGANLARVANPGHLKAQLKITETQAKDIQVGQVTSIDTRNGMVSGRVTRIDPAVQNGTVTVDVALEGELPKGARPDLSVDGTIELERLENVIYVGRPVQGQSQVTLGIFKLEADGKTAVRVSVKFGRSSVNSIEVLEGLKPGDKVILSDMSAWDNYNRIVLN